MASPKADPKPQLFSHNVTIPKALHDFARQQIEDGVYGNYSELARDAIRLLREREEERRQRLEAAREAAVASYKSHLAGENPGMTKEEFLNAFFKDRD